MLKYYDVVIAGGGMVGASLACSLASASNDALKVLVVETFPLPQNDAELSYQPSFDARSTALAAGSQTIFSAMGVWQQLAEYAQPISHIHVSNKGRLGSTLMDAVAEKLPALGYVVENHWLGKVLLHQLNSFNNVTWQSPAKVTAVEAASGSSQVSIAVAEQTEQVECGLLIIADGANSQLAQSIGIQYQQQSYHHTAIISNIVTAKPHQGMAFERFTNTGPLAMLPLVDVGNEARSALVWTMPNELAEEVLALSDAGFLARLQERFGYRLGKLLRCGERASYPLELVEAAEQVRRGIAVMGNAAHYLHPVAGQGFNLALRDVVALTELICAAKNKGEDVGSMQLLEQYYQSQQWDQRKTTTFSDKVGGVFMVEQPAFALLRDMGLGVLDILPGMKSRFVKETAGLAGVMPKW